MNGSLLGKRVLVFWTTNAYNEGSEWSAFRVLEECDEGLFCQGIDDPEGNKHDGSKCFIEYRDVLNILEWKEDA